MSGQDPKSKPLGFVMVFLQAKWSPNQQTNAEAESPTIQTVIKMPKPHAEVPCTG